MKQMGKATKKDTKESSSQGSDHEEGKIKHVIITKINITKKEKRFSFFC